MWENYYSTLKTLPKRLKELAPLIVESLPVFKQANVQTILDLGCGAGRHAIYLAVQGFDVIALDISKNALKIVRKWARKEKLENITLVQASMTHLPFNGDSIDAVISVSTIHHGLRKDMAKTIREIHRILTGKGVFLVNVASDKDPRYGEGKQIENGTFLVLEDFEGNQFEEIHHFCTENEVLDMFSSFAEKELKLEKSGFRYWEMKAFK
ncbi:MAG: class I SAM-dependent methyltransferase [Candidatus Bathyarchaeia archaeon]